MYFVLVAGNGESSRANTEALMEDYYYIKGAEGTLVLAYEKQPTKSQIFAAQYAKENNKEIMVFCNDDAQTTGIPGASQSPSSQPVKDAVDFLTGQDSIAYLLWSEEDTSILSECQRSGIPASNLCDGLVPLNEILAPKPLPVEVKKEEIKTPVVNEPIDDFKALLISHIKTSQELLARMG